MPLSDKDVAALIAELEKAKRGKEAMQADLVRTKRELEREKRELEKSKWTKELLKREDEAELDWLQSETVEIPMLPLVEGPEQSAPTTVALAAEAPAAEVMTDTRVFPDTAAPDASVERATDTRVSPDIAAPDASVERAASNCNSSKSSSNGSNSNGSSSSNETTSNYGPCWDTTCVIALLRPFDPGKGYQRDVRRGKAVLGVDLPFDRRKSWGRMQHGG